MRHNQLITNKIMKDAKIKFNKTMADVCKQFVNYERKI
jgi:hypothetical protein